MGNLFGRYAAFLVFVTDLVPAAPVGKAYGIIPFSLVLKMHFLACFPCDFRQDASFFEISQQDRVRQRINAYLPVAGSLRFRLPGRGCYRTESSRKMSLYRFKRIRDILRLLKLHRQGDEVPSLSDADIVSEVAGCAHLERRCLLLTERGTIPDTVPLLFYRVEPHTPEIILQLNALGFFNVHCVTD